MICLPSLAPLAMKKIVTQKAVKTLGTPQPLFLDPAGRGKVIPAPNAARRGPVGLKVRRQQRGNGPFSHLATKRIPNTLSPNSRFALRR